MNRGVEAAGILPVDKPVGPTSHAIVARARHALATRRIGHTGTLDPFASGLLLLCIGPATRLAEYLDSLEKSYTATAILGESTDTDDCEGVVTRSSDAWRGLTRPLIEEALLPFRGTILQVPPAFSAKKVEGEAMYHKARRGEVVDLPPVTVQVHEIELLDVRLPEIDFHVRCSTGTYIRAIARDVGEALGVGAHLTALRRTRIGPFSVDEAVPADRLSDAEEVRERWVSPARALAHLPAQEIDDEDLARIVRGQAILRGEGQGEPEVDEGSPVELGPVALLHRGVLVAVALPRGENLHPRKVFAPSAGLT